MKVADYIADVLVAQRVPAIFELVGGMTTHMLDAVHRKGETPIISVRHEQGAAFAAEGCGRMLGRPAVAMATSGPGAINLLTGIGSCYFDSTPAVFITGQVNRNEQKGARNIRQLGFQETDIVSMASPIVKRAWRVQQESEIPAVFREAFQTAAAGRPGPVLIDIPMDVQRAEIDGAVEASARPIQPSGLSPGDAGVILNALLSARMPMILAGGGIRSGSAIGQFRRFIDCAAIPVVHSLMGVDLLPYHHPLNVGMIGSYGNRWANLALSQCDCLLVLGSRLDVRQTGVNTAAFKGDRMIFHIDCETAEINNRVLNCNATVSELGPALDILIEVFEPLRARLRKNSRAWLETIARLRSRWPDTSELAGSPGINPNVLMHTLSAALSEIGAYVADVGQHQMWAAQSLELGEGERFLTSGGMGAMGFALPAAVGAAVAAKGLPIVVIAGDGGFQCNIQELETVSHLQLAIRIVVMNNGCHGMVRQFQESYFEGRYQSTVWGYSAPDFARIAEAYGIPSRTAGTLGEAAQGVEWLSQRSAGPSLLQVMIPQTTNAYPKLAFGHGLEAMEPFVKPLGMEGT